MVWNNVRVSLFFPSWLSRTGSTLCSLGPDLLQVKRCRCDSNRISVTTRRHYHSVQLCNGYLLSYLLFIPTVIRSSSCSCSFILRSYFTREDLKDVKFLLQLLPTCRHSKMGALSWKREELLMNLRELDLPAKTKQIWQILGKDSSSTQVPSAIAHDNADGQ